MAALPCLSHAPCVTTARTTGADPQGRPPLSQAVATRLPPVLAALAPALPRHPLHPPPHHDLHACVQHAEHLLARHRPGDVLDTLDRLDADLPRSAAWHLTRASALSALHDDRQAAHAASTALIDPNASPGSVLHRRALLQLGHSLTRQHAHADAAWCYRSLLAEHPQAVDAALHAALGSAALLDWERLPADLHRLQAAAQPGATASLTPQVWLDPCALLPLLDDPALLRWYAELAWAQRHGSRPHATRPRPPARQAPRHGRWRLGVLMGGRGRARVERDTPALDLFAWFDPAEVELYFYSDAWADLPGAAPRHPHLRAHATAWHDSRHLDTDDLVGVVRGDRIDLLLDLSHSGDDTRLDVLSQRPAPLQVAWTCHAGTTGHPCIDYLIGDPVTTPLTAQPQFSECLAQLPQRPWNPTPLDTGLPPTPTRTACGLPDSALVLACFTRPERLNPTQFQQWCALLQAVPEAVLWLLAPQPQAQSRLQDSLHRAGLSPQRLVFAPWQPHAAHQARLPLADLVLDTTPGNAETAARDALQAGVPVLTQMGRSPPARRTAALLHRLGLHALACETPEQALRTAVQFLREPDTRALVRAQLRDTLTHDSTSTDLHRQALDLQHLLQRMLARAETGRPPAPLAAAPSPRRI